MAGAGVTRGPSRRLRRREFLAGAAALSLAPRAEAQGPAVPPPSPPPNVPPPVARPVAPPPVGSRQALIDAIVASEPGDVIRIAPGSYDRFIWPKSTSHALTLVAADRADPPVMRGIYCNDTPDQYWPSGQSPRGDWARNVTFDGLTFRPEVLREVRTSEGEAVSIVDADGEGYGWRADYSFPGVTESGEGAGFIGLRLGSGCEDITVVNCLFEHFAKGISIGRATRITAWHNTFSRICEDGVMFWGGSALDFQYNEWTNSRGVSLQAARAYGWSRPEPVHQDFFQIACNSPGQNVDGLTISNNVMHDDTGRVHGVLLNNRYVAQGGDPSSRHRNVTVEDNFLKQTHTTGLQLTNVVGLVCRRNKVMRSRVIPGSRKNDVAIVFGSWGREGSTRNMEDVIVEDNVSRKYVGRDSNPSWRVSGNITSNLEAVLPPGWVEIRPGLAGAGRRAGRYGQW